MSLKYVERLKSLLIAALLIVAVLLVMLTPIYKELTGEMPAQTWYRLTTVPTSDIGTLPQEAAAIPSVIAIGSGHARYGVRYDESVAGSVYNELSPLLGDALRTAGSPRAVTEEEWLTALTGANIYLFYPGRVPLPVLTSWLCGEDEPQTPLSGSVRQLLLCPDSDGTLLLCYRNEVDGQYCFCQTSPALTGRLEDLCADYLSNEAVFACETDSSLAPAMLLLPEPLSAPVLTAGAVAFTDSAMNALLTAMEFNPRTNATYFSDAGRVVLEGASTLRIGSDGNVSYESGGESRLLIREGSEAQAIEAARQLAQKTVGTQCGDASLYLMDAGYDEEGAYVIRFGYCLDGMPILPEGAGCAALFRVAEGRVDSCVLHYRTYARTDTPVLLLPEEQTAAALHAMGQDGSLLTAGYAGSGSSLSPVWLVL